MKKNIPKLGEIRLVAKFAWLPIKTDKGEIIWLSKYFQSEELKSFPPSGPVAGLQYYEWVSIRKFTISKILK